MTTSIMTIDTFETTMYPAGGRRALIQEPPYRRDTASNWTMRAAVGKSWMAEHPGSSPTSIPQSAGWLMDREIGIEIDTLRRKRGPGFWDDLDYLVFKQYRGSGAPSTSLGWRNDWYLDETNKLMYGPKPTPTSWGTPVSMVGPAGANGTNGTNGSVGPSGVASATAPLTYNSGTQTVAITAASTSAAGSMSSADKTRLDALYASAWQVGTVTTNASGIATFTYPNAFGSGVVPIVQALPIALTSTNLYNVQLNATPTNTSAVLKVNVIGGTAISLLGLLSLTLFTPAPSGVSIQVAVRAP